MCRLCGTEVILKGLRGGEADKGWEGVGFYSPGTQFPSANTNAHVHGNPETFIPGEKVSWQYRGSRA